MRSYSFVPTELQTGVTLSLWLKEGLEVMPVVTMCLTAVGVLRGVQLGVLWPPCTAGVSECDVWGLCTP